MALKAVEYEFLKLLWGMKRTVKKGRCKEQSLPILANKKWNKSDEPNLKLTIYSIF